MNPSPTSRGEGILPSQSRLEPQSRGQDALATEKRAPRVVIVGGGLAGMAAAVALEDAGVDVTLLEARRSLGGRAGSFDDPQTGEELDNCQHVLLGCCTNLIDFYRRLGASDLIRWERTILFLYATGARPVLFGIDALPAPLD